MWRHTEAIDIIWNHPNRVILESDELSHVVLACNISYHFRLRRLIDVPEEKAQSIFWRRRWHSRYS